MATPRWVACVVCGAGCMLAAYRSAHSVESTAAQPASQHPRSFQPERLIRIALLGDLAFRQPASLRAIHPIADGKQIITIGADDTIRFWDTATGKEQRRLDMPEAFSLYCVCFLPDAVLVYRVLTTEQSGHRTPHNGYGNNENKSIT